MESREREDALRPHSGSLRTLGSLLNAASVVDRRRRSRASYSFIARWLAQSRSREDRSKAKESPMNSSIVELKLIQPQSIITRKLLLWMSIISILAATCG